MRRKTTHRLALLLAASAQAMVAVSGCGADSSQGASDLLANGGGIGGSGGSLVPDADAGRPGDPAGGNRQPLADGTGETTEPVSDPIAPDLSWRPVASAEFEGIDIGSMPMAKTPGCVGGFGLTTGTLALAVEPATSSLVVDARDGNLRANGTSCTAPDGTPAAAELVTRLAITGTDGDDIIVLDLLGDSLGDALLTVTGAIQIDGGAGQDAVAVRGTRGDDHFGCVGATTTEGIGSFDFGQGALALSFARVESVVASLGPGTDSFAGSGRVPCAVPLIIYGGPGSDTLQGGARDDVLNGGDGGDTFDTGSTVRGADVINGGGDEDFVTFLRRTHGVRIELCVARSNAGCSSLDCACAGVSGEAGEQITVVNVEDAQGGAGDDTIVGTAEPNALLGEGGSDRIEGAAGADQLYGNDGDDLLLGGDDDDILSGGAGADTLDGQKGDNICLYDGSDSTYQSCQTPVLLKY